MNHLPEEARRWSGPALEQAPVAITVLDPAGRVQFYNSYAATILDRRPEYLGRDVRSLHHPASQKKIDAILADYAAGGRREYCWRLKRGDLEFLVRVAPLMRDGKWSGLVHAVMVL